MKKLTMFTFACLATFAVAQDDAKPVPAAKPKAEQEAPKQDAAKPSPEAEGLIQALAKKLADKDQMVRDMSEAALTRAGKAALPTLAALATSENKDLAAAAKKLAERIERGADRRPGAAGGTMEERVDALAKQMGLDEAKTKKLKAAQKAATDRMTEMREAVTSGEMNREEAMAAMQNAREDLKNDLKKNGFSDDEVTKIEQELVRGMMGGGRGQGGGGGRGGRGGGGGGG